MGWRMIIKTKSSEHMVELAGDEGAATEALTTAERDLEKARRLAGGPGLVKFGDRVVVPSADVTSIAIYDRQATARSVSLG